MFRGGVFTIYVSDMDRSVRFYIETLGMKLIERHGNHWASIDGGPGLSIGLHPATPEVAVGLYLDGSIGEAVKQLSGKGVRFDGPITDE